MLKPGPNYKMSKQTKMLLASSLILDQHLRAAQKRSMIQAELYSAIQPRRERNKKEAVE